MRGDGGVAEVGGNGRREKGEGREGNGGKEEEEVMRIQAVVSEGCFNVGQGEVRRFCMGTFVGETELCEVFFLG